MKLLQDANIKFVLLMVGIFLLGKISLKLSLRLENVTSAW